MTKVIMRKENGKRIIHFCEKDPKEMLKGQMPHIYPSCECYHMQNPDNHHWRKKKLSHLTAKRKYLSHRSTYLCSQEMLRCGIFKQKQ